MTVDQTRITPVVPDWTVVSAPRARRAIEGTVAAGHYDSRLGGLDWHASVVLRLYARPCRPPAIDELVADAALPGSSIKEHLVQLEGTGHTLATMCAIDALGPAQCVETM
jgi:hypothetical protein